MAPIQPGLEQYPAGSVEFILGTATYVDPSSRTVHIDLGSGNTAPPITITYDHLVLATGAQAAHPALPWKASGSHAELLEALHGTAEKIRKAKHVVIAGGGPTGVELAGEIRFAYPDTTVVLISSEDRLVGGDSIAGSVENELRRLGVEIRGGLRVEDTSETSQGKTTVRLSDGTTLVTDAYLPTMGLRPNTDFLPKSWLNERQYANVDDEMRVQTAENVWAVGDIVSQPRASFMITEAQAAGVYKNIDLALKGKPAQRVSGPMVDAFLCSTGRSRGAGRLNFVHVPSFAVWAVKGRTLGLERTQKYVDGSMF